MINKRLLILGALLLLPSYLQAKVSSVTAILLPVKTCMSVDAGLISIQNSGQNPVSNIVITETLPDGLLFNPGSVRWRVLPGSWNGSSASFDPASPVSPLQWNSNNIPGLSGLAPGETLEIEFAFTVHCSYTGGNVTLAVQYDETGSTLNTDG